MKFLVDNQLPAALATHLRDRGFDCQHVLEVGLNTAPDSEICSYAERHERIIISKDEDFLFLRKTTSIENPIDLGSSGKLQNSYIVGFVQPFLATDRIVASVR